MGEGKRWFSWAHVAEHVVAHWIASAGVAIFFVVGGLGVWKTGYFPKVLDLLKAAWTWAVEVLAFLVPVPVWVILILMWFCWIASIRFRVLRRERDALTKANHQQLSPPAAPPDVDAGSDEDRVIRAFGIADGESCNPLELSRQINIPRLRVDEALSGLIAKSLIKQFNGVMGSYIVLTDAGRRFVLKKGYLRDRRK